MKRVEAFQADDGTVFGDKIECAKHDLRMALKKFQSAIQVDAIHHPELDVPRKTLRDALELAYRRLRTAQQCLKDLDHYDEDPTDPERIEAARKAAEREAKRQFDEAERANGPKQAGEPR